MSLAGHCATWCFYVIKTLWHRDAGMTNNICCLSHVTTLLTRGEGPDRSGLESYSHCTMYMLSLKQTKHDTRAATIVATYGLVSMGTDNDANYHSQVAQYRRSDPRYGNQHTFHRWPVRSNHRRMTVDPLEDSGLCYIWKAASRLFHRTLELWGNTNHTVASVSFDPQSTRVATTYNQKSIIAIWTILSGTSPLVVVGAHSLISKMTFSHDGQLVLAVLENTTMKVWSTMTGDCMPSLDGGNSGIQDGANAPAP